MIRFPRFARRAFLKFAFIFPFLQLLVIGVQWNRTDYDRDSVAYYLASERIQNGESMYEPYPPPGPHVMDEWYYLYPPFLAPALTLIPTRSVDAFLRIWLLVCMAGYWVFALCLGRIVQGRVTLRSTLVAGAALYFVPGVLQAINLAQADMLVWAMVGLSLAFPSLRGAGFAAAALTKVHGFWPLLVSLWRERWRAMKGAAAVTLLAVTMSCVVLSPRGFFDSSVEWMTRVAPVLSQGQFPQEQETGVIQLPFGWGTFAAPMLFTSNLSVSFAPLQVAKATGIWAPEPGDLPTGVRLYLMALSLAAPLVSGWVFRRQPPTLHYSLVLAATLLFSPILRITYTPVLILPAILYLAEKNRRLGHGQATGH
jgi:hypothetical protein